VTLSIKHVDDLIEAHEITDEGQILRHGRLIRMREAPATMCEFANVTHCECNAHSDRAEAPSPGIRRLLLRSHWRCEVLVEDGAMTNV